MFTTVTCKWPDQVLKLQHWASQNSTTASAPALKTKNKKIQTECNLMSHHQVVQGKEGWLGGCNEYERQWWWCWGVEKTLGVISVGSLMQWWGSKITPGSNNVSLNFIKTLLSVEANFKSYLQRAFLLICVRVLWHWNNKFKLKKRHMQKSIIYQPT